MSQLANATEVDPALQTEIPILQRTRTTSARGSLEKDAKSREGGEEAVQADGACANNSKTNLLRPPIVWNDGLCGFWESFVDRLQSVFSRRMVLSLLVRLPENSTTPAH